MTTSATVPVTVAPEAAARIAELGIQAAVDQLLGHALQTIPELQRLEVVLDGPYDTHEEPYLAIRATTDRILVPGDTTEREWRDWKLATFPPEVLEHITLLFVPGGGHAG